MSYGMPYMGSKSTIAEKIIGFLPQAEYFVDLFGGGGAMTDCAVQSGKYKRFIYNELDPLIFKAFGMAINGEFSNEIRWISREEFFKLNDSDPYVSLCFSFSNDRRTYAYGRDLEIYKKAAHDYIFCNNRDLERYYDIPPNIFDIEDKQEKRVSLFRIIKKQNDENKSKGEINRLYSLQSLQHLERLKSLQHLELSNLSYDNVVIPKNCIVYADPPYEGTAEYKLEFDKDKFVNYCRNAEYPIYISEYKMPEDFVCVAQFERTSTMSPKSREKMCEKLFVHESKYSETQHTLFDFKEEAI